MKHLMALAAGLTVALLPIGAAAAPRAMTAIDLLELQTASAPRPSPRGDAILYHVSRADWKRNRKVSGLWLASADGSPPRLLLRSGGADAIWSPDGRTIAYASRRKGDKARQIYLLGTGEGAKPTRLTGNATDVGQFRWAPDGRSLYFITRTPDDPGTRARRRAGDDMTPFESPRRRQALYRVDVAGGAITRVIGGDFEVRSFDLSGNGAMILYRRASSGLNDDQPHSELWLYRAGQPDRRLTDNDYAESNARLSRDGRRALFVANAKDGRYGTFNAGLFVLDIDSGRITGLGGGAPWSVEEAEWAPDGQTVYFTAQAGVRTNLYAIAARGGKAKPLVRCDCVVSSIAVSADGSRLAYVMGSATQPAEIFRIDPRRPRPVGVSHLNDDIAARFLLPRQEAIGWTGPEGQKLEGLVTYPVGYRPGGRYPLIVQNHGGPRSADKFGIFAYGRFTPLLAAHGFMVLSVNYRGGTGYGDAFLQGMNGGYFRVADRDVLSGVDELVARGMADPDRLGVMGWSAGGHMTARLETVTTRFKAAAVGAGAVDWTSMYLTSDTRWQRQEWFLTPPYGSTARRDLYETYSPLYAADKVRTPTLILAGAEDKRVPSAQAVMLYRALRGEGVETQLYLAPREPHNFRELRHRLFQINVEMGWFTRLVGGTPYTEAKAPETADADR